MAAKGCREVRDRDTIYKDQIGKENARRLVGGFRSVAAGTERLQRNLVRRGRLVPESVSGSAGAPRSCATRSWIWGPSSSTVD